VAHPANSLLRINLHEGAPSRLLLAGWGFSSVEPEGFGSQGKGWWPTYPVAHICPPLANVGLFSVIANELIVALLSGR